MPEVRARVFEYRVTTDADWNAYSERGGAAIGRDEAWSPEHLLLAALVRCTLTSLEYHAKRSDVTFTATADAHCAVTRREEDGRFAIVSIDVAVTVAFTPALDRASARDLLERAEHDCFVGASLTVTPAYVWTVDGEEL